MKSVKSSPSNTQIVFSSIIMRKDWKSIEKRFLKQIHD